MIAEDGGLLVSLQLSVVVVDVVVVVVGVVVNVVVVGVGDLLVPLLSVACDGVMV